jgi:septal ring factor EnvC (AmiA/AmiB activator)
VWLTSVCCFTPAFIFPQLSAERQSLADELSQLHTSHKQLQEQKEALDTELGSLKPAHAELQQMHDKASSELQSTKEALQKSQEARVRAEVRSAADACLAMWLQSSCIRTAPASFWELALLTGHCPQQGGGVTTYWHLHV